MQNHRWPPPSVVAGPDALDPQGYLGGFRLRALAAGAALLSVFLNLPVWCWCAYRLHYGEVFWPVKPVCNDQAECCLMYSSQVAS